MRKLNKILLLNPFKTEGEVLAPPLGLAYLAGYARPFFPKCVFKIFDFDVDKTPQVEQIKIVKKEKPDVIVVTATTLSIASALELAKLLKKKITRNIPIFLGGSHVTATQEQRYPNIDSVVLGEGEQALVELLKIHQSGKRYPKQYETKFLKDINFLPAWDLVNFKKYAGFNPAKFNPQAIVFWSRGCPFNCVFCSNCVWRGSIPRVRYRNPQNIVDELELLIEKYKIKEIFVGDDEANTNPKWLASVCDEIISRKIPINWKCQMRVNEPLTPEDLFEKMKKAGCWHIAWGIESGVNRVLKGIQKMITTKEIRRALVLSKKVGLRNMGLFMLGNIWRDKNGHLSGETYKDCLRSIAFATKLQKKKLLDYVNFNIATPYPGSEMWEIIKEFDLAKTKDFDKWSTEQMDLHGVAFNHPYLSEKQLLELHQKAWKQFSLSPIFVMRHLLDIRSLAEARCFINNVKVIIRVLFTGHTR